MKTPSLRLSILVLTQALLPAALFAQGSLTPPGAPAPGLKTLDQIEARIPISTVPFNITQSGSYYLTGNLSVATGTAINITTDNVSLDLNGYTISSTANPASGYAVAITGTGLRNFNIRNGHVRSGTTGSGGSYTQLGFLAGIYAVNVPTNVTVSEITVSGTGLHGIDFSSDSNVVVERCGVDTCSARGILAGTIHNCWARNTGAAALSASTISGSRGVCSSTGAGVDADNASNSSGQSSGGIGLVASDTALNCTGVSFSGVGLQAEVALNCRGTSNSNVGLVATNATNCSAASNSGAQGMLIAGTAQSCRASRTAGVAISAGIAIGCTVAGTGTITSSSKFLGTP